MLFDHDFSILCVASRSNAYLEHACGMWKIPVSAPNLPNAPTRVEICPLLWSVSNHPGSSWSLHTCMSYLGLANCMVCQIHGFFNWNRRESDGVECETELLGKSGSEISMGDSVSMGDRFETGNVESKLCTRAPLVHSVKQLFFIENVLVSISLRKSMIINDFL